jgi:hypothetical protein
MEAQHLAHPWPRRVVPPKERAVPPLRVPCERDIPALSLHAGDDQPDSLSGVEAAVDHGNLGRRLTELEVAEGSGEERTTALQRNGHGRPDSTFSERPFSSISLNCPQEPERHPLCEEDSH